MHIKSHQIPLVPLVKFRGSEPYSVWYTDYKMNSFITEDKSFVA